MRTTLRMSRVGLILVVAAAFTPARTAAQGCTAQLRASYPGTGCAIATGSFVSVCCTAIPFYCGTGKQAGEPSCPPDDPVSACGDMSSICGADDRPCTPSPPKCGNADETDCNGVSGDGCAPCEGCECAGPGGPGMPPAGGGPGPGCGGPGMAGDPIMLGVQAVATLPFSDFTVDRLSPLSLVRRYSSADVDFDGYGPGGIFGMGWHHDWDVTLSCRDGVCTVRRGLLPGYRFALDGAYRSVDGTETLNVYRAWAPAGYAPSHRHVLVQRPDATWVLFGTDGSELHFASVCTSCDVPGSDPCRSPLQGGAARLVKLVGRGGHAVQLDHAAPGGVLLRLTDELGHVLQVSGAGACPSHASELTYDGAVVARYTITGHLLEAVTDADGKVVRAYVNGSFGGRWPRLQAILDESGAAIAEFSYDTSLRAIGAVAAESSVEVTYGPNANEDGSSAVVTEHFRGRDGDMTATSEQRLDWNRRVTAISKGGALPEAELKWTPGGQLACSRDPGGHTVVQEFDALGRTVHRVELEGTSCDLPATLPAEAREEWRTYGVRRAVAQGVDLELDAATAVLRQSGVSPGDLVGETFDYNPAPESIDPADYTCQATPLPAGSVVCRQLTSGYVRGASGPVLERHATFFSYDAKGRLVRTYGPVDLDHPGASDVPPVEERTYWGDGESAARQGRLREVKRYPSPSAAPLITTYDHDSFGVYRVVGPTGSSSTFVKDGRGRTTFVLQADAGGIVRARTETRYHDGNLPRLRILPGGAAERYRYDARGRLQATEHLSGDPEAPGASPALGWSEWFAYDQAGNRIHAERRDRDGRVTWQQDRAFDVQHRVVWESNPAMPGTGRSWSYDASGFLAAVTDEEGRATAFTPDPLKRVRKVTRTGRDANGAPASVDVAGYQYAPGHDTLASVTDGAGRATGYTYDDFGRVQQVSAGSLSRAGGVWYRHDARGNPVARGDQTVTISYTYDGMDRLLTETATNSSDGSSLAYALRYDEGAEAGRLTTIVEPDRTVTFTYDWAGRLTTETVRENGVAAPLVTAYAYDVDGAVQQVTYPSGLVVQLDRDPATREVSAVRNGPGGPAWANGITRHPGGPLASLTFGNGRTLAQTYNARYEPLTIASGPLALAYGMSPAGDVGVVTDRSEDPAGCVRAVARSARYDLQDRLVSWEDAAQSGTGICAPDTLGSAAGELTYVSGSDQVASQLGADGTTPALAFGYDLQGNVSAIGKYDAAGQALALALCLRHDALGRMVLAGRTTAAFAPGGTVCTSDAEVTSPLARYRYDLRNRRVARQRDGTWTYVVSDGGGNPLSELGLADGTWTRVRDYVWLDGRLLAQLEYGSGAAHAYYAHLDHLGTPRALTNEAGQVVWSVFQRPYGAVLEKTVLDPVSAQTVVTNLRLPGQYDERLFAQAGISGLQGPYYNWNRWYLPSVGRYLELDPIALGGGMNGPGTPDWYNYALGNPVRFTDREGAAVVVDDVILAGMGIALIIEYVRACTATNTCPWSPSPQCSQPKKPWVWNPPRPNPIPLPPIPPEIKGPCEAEVNACFQRQGNWRQCLDCQARCIGLGGIWPLDPRC